MTLAESLISGGNPGVFVHSGSEQFVNSLATEAQRLARVIRTRGPLLVLSNSPIDVLTGLIVAETLNIRVIVGHANLPHEQISRIRDSLGVASVLRPQFALEQVETPSRTDDSGCEVLLMTSGTTGTPKIARHSVSALLGRIRPSNQGSDQRWLLTYPPTSFAGLQVVLTAALSGARLLSTSNGRVADLVALARTTQPTHVSGTPTFWRAFLLALRPEEAIPSIVSITLGGEVADQATLNRLAARFPTARIVHIYASTEGGALFSVQDGMAGFPSEWLVTGKDGVDLKIVDDQLWVRSPRRMAGYASEHILRMTDDGWLCTGDLVKQIEGRVHFTGRVDQMLNIAGSKVLPVEIESVILQVDGVADVLISAARSPITGFVIRADIVPSATAGPDLVARVSRHCRQSLPSFQVPRVIRIIASDLQSSSGKKIQRGSI